MNKNKKPVLFAVLVVAVLALSSFLFLLSSLKNVSATSFIGPSQTAGTGAGAIGYDSSFNLAIGTSTTQSDTKLLIVGSSTDSSYFAIKVLDLSRGPLLVVRSDGSVTIGSTFIQSDQQGSTTTIPNVGTAPSNGALFVNGPIRTTLDLKAGGIAVGTTTPQSGGNGYFTGTVTANTFAGSFSAANVSADVFGRLQGNGNFAFPASLGVATSSQVGLPQPLSVYGNAYVSGSVGIGTVGPDAKLHVVGSVCAESSDTGCAPTSGYVRGAGLCIGADCKTSWPVGTVTSVDSGGGLTGGPITAAGTLAVGAGNGISVAADSVAVNTTGISSCTNGTTNKIIWDGTNNYLTCATDQNSGGTISGSGTANYATKFTATSTLGNSIIYDNGTNVGIGTVGPDAKLHVVGSVCAESSDTGCAPTSGYVRGAGLCIGADCRTSWPNEGLWTAGTGGIYYTGNVSVGVSSISYPLYVSSSTDSLFVINRVGATYPTIFKEGTDGALVINNNNGDAMTLKSGNVGIGTVGPDAKLHVVGSVCAESSDTGCAPTSGYVRGAGLCIGADCRTSWPDSAITGSGTANYLTKFTATTTIGNSSIQDNGTNVGIGVVPDASYALKVNGAVKIDGAAEIYGNAGLTLFDNGAGTIALNVSGSDDFVFGSSAMEVRDGVGTVVASINTAGQAYFAGKVGIGNSSSTAGLSVGSSAGAGYATLATEIYAQGDIEADGSIYMANNLVATQSWVTSQGYLSGESDPQVATVTNTYMCYGNGSAVTCEDSGVTFNTTSNAITAGDFICTDCLGDAEITGLTSTSVNSAADLVCTGCIGATEIGDGLGTAEIDETVMQQRVSGTCTGDSAVQSVAQGGTVGCSTDRIGTLTSGYVCYNDGTAVQCADNALTWDAINNDLVINGSFYIGDTTGLTHGLTGSGTNISIRSVDGINLEATNNNYFKVGGTIKATINSFGLGIGRVPTTYTLELNTDSAAKPNGGSWTTLASDRRVKKDVRPFEDGLDVILGINPIWYKYNGKGIFAADEKDYIGVVAQDVVGVAPYTVGTYKAKLNPDDPEETELFNFNDSALTFVLINSVKELNSKIEKLESRIGVLEGELAEFKKISN